MRRFSLLYLGPVLIDNLLQDHELELPVLLLSLEVIRKESPPDAQRYYDCKFTVRAFPYTFGTTFSYKRNADLVAIIKGMEVVESNFNM